MPVLYHGINRDNQYRVCIQTCFEREGERERESCPAIKFRIRSGFNQGEIRAYIMNRDICIS